MGEKKFVRVLPERVRGEEREWGSFVFLCGRVCESRVGVGGCCYSRLPVNNATGECFMARAGL